MAIPVWKEGTQRYHDPNTQKMVKTKDAEAQIAEEKAKGKATGTVAGFGAGSALGSVAGPIVAALRKEFSALNSHLAFRFEDIKKAILGDPTEQREQRLEGENVVVPPEDTDTDGGDKRGFLGNLKDRFSGGIGTKTAILLLVGGLWAITTLGDKLIKPLSGFLKWLKEDAMEDVGNLWKTVVGWWDTAWGHMETFFEFMLELLPGIGVLHDKLKLWYEEDWPLLVKKFEDLKTTVQVWWDEQWPKVEKFFEWVGGIFTSIGDYVDKFDTDDVKGLSTEERKKMWEDLRNKVSEAAGGYITAITLGLLTFMFGPALIKAAISIGGALITKTITGTAATTAAAAAGSGPGMAAKGMAFLAKNAAKIGIVGLVVGGIAGVYSAAKDAFVNSVDEETGKIDKSKFASFFIAGDGEGGWKGAIENAFTGGPTAAGALIGVGLGAIGGPFGMLAGGLMGAAIGGLIGGIAGYIGPEGVESMVDGTVGLFKSAVDDISTFFGKFFAGVESFAKGEGFAYGQAAYLSRIAPSSAEQITAIDDAQIDVDILRQEWENTPTFAEGGSKGGKEMARRKYQAALNKLNRLKNQKEEIDEIRAQVSSHKRTKALEELPGLRTELLNIDRTKPNRGWERKEGTLLKKIAEHEANLNPADLAASQLQAPVSFADMYGPENNQARYRIGEFALQDGGYNMGSYFVNTGDSNVVNNEEIVVSELTPDNREISAALANQYRLVTP